MPRSSGRALKIHRVVIGAGWEAALAEFKPEAKAPKPTVPSTVCATMGQVIEAATRLSSARKESLDTYAKALRRIATGVLGVKGGKTDGKPRRRPSNSLRWSASTH